MSAVQQPMSAPAPVPTGAPKAKGIGLTDSAVARLQRLLAGKDSAQSVAKLMQKAYVTGQAQ